MRKSQNTSLCLARATEKRKIGWVGPCTSTHDLDIALTKAEDVLDLGKQFLALPKLFGNVSFPFRYINGHYVLNFYNLAKEDGHEAAQIFLTNQSWNRRSASSLLNYVKFDNKPKFQNESCLPLPSEIKNLRG